MARILCVDDEPLNLSLLEAMLSPRGYDVVSAVNGPEALEKIRAERIDICLLDVMMPGMDGFEVCRRIKHDDLHRNIPVVMITSHADTENRIRGIEAGAEDFISKPFDRAEVLARIKMLLHVKSLNEQLQNAHDNLELTVQERTRELTSANVQLTQEIAERKRAEASLQGTYAEIKGLKERLQAENIYLQQEVSREYNFGEIIGQSNALSDVFLKVEQVAPMNATVLLLGETGTGKGVVARALHSSSSRKNRPLITVDCTTLPATLVESELFGRERGAFTGSDSKQIGRFELADGGTIFLDEIGEMPLELQCKLLRVIQDGEFERLGSPRTIKTDVRIIAATNRNLAEEAKNGKFREDLFYRLNVFPITMPPLRQRRDDIPLLVNHFVAKFNLKIGKKIETVTKDTLNALQVYHWPGNVRELESVIERAVIISNGNSLQVLDRFDTFHKTEELVGQDIKALGEMEHVLIVQALKKCGWRIEGKKGAALHLGLNASTLRYRMQKFGIMRD
jgi:DNA-binding NtrC family response regulator